MLYSQGKRSKLHYKPYIHVVWARRFTLLSMVDRSTERFEFNQIFGRKVPTIKYKTIDLRLREVDGKEGIFLFENYE